MPNGLIKRHTFVLNHKANDFRGKGPLPHTNRLFVCEERDPPNYKNNSGNITRCWGGRVLGIYNPGNPSKKLSHRA